MQKKDATKENRATLSPTEALAAAREKIATRKRSELESALADYRMYVNLIAEGKPLDESDGDRLYGSMEILKLADADLVSDVEVVQKVNANPDFVDREKWGAAAERLGQDEMEKRAAVDKAMEALAAAREALRQAELNNSMHGMQLSDMNATKARNVHVFGSVEAALAGNGENVGSDAAIRQQARVLVGNR